MSIVSPEPDSNTQPPASLRGVAELMSKSPDAFTANVGWLLDYIASSHETPVTCDECNNRDPREGLPCMLHESALSAAFAWLFKVVDERG